MCQATRLGSSATRTGFLLDGGEPRWTNVERRSADATLISMSRDRPHPDRSSHAMASMSFWCYDIFFELRSARSFQNVHRGRYERVFCSKLTSHRLLTIRSANPSLWVCVKIPLQTDPFCGRGFLILKQGDAYLQRVSHQVTNERHASLLTSLFISKEKATLMTEGTACRLHDSV